jgi:nitrogen fixation protein
MINHTPIKQVRLEENIILIKDVQKWGDQKLLKNAMKKKVLYKISKDQSLKIE